RDFHVTGVQTCALPIYRVARRDRRAARGALAALKEPTEQRDVLEGADPVPARRAVRARHDQVVAVGGRSVLAANLGRLLRPLARSEERPVGEEGSAGGT